MSYLGYVKLMTTHCKAFEKPKILEIGVDRGQTTLPLLSNLLQVTEDFQYIGIDIREDFCFSEQVSQMQGLRIAEPNGPPDFNFGYAIQNSLNLLPAFVSDGAKFDLILIDGDHNYGTVKQELSYLNDISHSHTLVICDDYSGRHKDSDTFYKDYESHSEISAFSDVEIHPDKKGANQAIDEWLKEEKGKWWAYKPPEFEPIFLCSHGIQKFKSVGHHKLGLAEYVISYLQPGTDGETFTHYSSQ